MRLIAITIIVWCYLGSTITPGILGASSSSDSDVCLKNDTTCVESSNLTDVNLDSLSNVDSVMLVHGNLEEFVLSPDRWKFLNEKMALENISSAQQTLLSNETLMERYYYHMLQSYKEENYDHLEWLEDRLTNHIGSDIFDESNSQIYKLTYSEKIQQILYRYYKHNYDQSSKHERRYLDIIKYLYEPRGKSSKKSTQGIKYATNINVTTDVGDENVSNVITNDEIGDMIQHQLDTVWNQAISEAVKPKSMVDKEKIVNALRKLSSFAIPYMIDQFADGLEKWNHNQFNQSYQLLFSCIFAETHGPSLHENKMTSLHFLSYHNRTKLLNLIVQSVKYQINSKIDKLDKLKVNFNRVEVPLLDYLTLDELNDILYQAPLITRSWNFMSVYLKKLQSIELSQHENDWDEEEDEVPLNLKYNYIMRLYDYYVSNVTEKVKSLLNGDQKISQKSFCNEMITAATIIKDIVKFLRDYYWFIDKNSILFEQKGIIVRKEFNIDLMLKYFKLPIEEVYNTGRTETKNLHKQGNESNKKMCTRHPQFLEADFFRDFITFLLENKEDILVARNIKSNNIKDIFGNFDEYYINESWIDKMESKWIKSMQNQENNVKLAFDQRKNPIYFDIKDTDAPTLFVQVKNIDEVLVKIYKVNSFSYFRQQHDSQMETLNLDGIGASYEWTIEKITNKNEIVIKLPKDLIGKRGYYIIDLLSVKHGKQCRVVIQMGNIQVASLISRNGNLLYLFDESNQIIQNGSVVMDNRVFTTEIDSNGAILIPFYTKVRSDSEYEDDDNLEGIDYLRDYKSRKILLRRSDDPNFYVASRFSQMTEYYQLKSNIYIDREQMIAGKTASVIIRSSLTLGDRIAVSLKLIENVKLSIKMTYINDNGEKQTIGKYFDNFTLYDTRESIQMFRMINNVISIDVELAGKVTRQNGHAQSLSQSKSFLLNQIIEKDRFHQLFAIPSTTHNDSIIIASYGKNGEPVPATLNKIQLKSKLLRRETSLSLNSDREFKQGFLHITNDKDSNNGRYMLDSIHITTNNNDNNNNGIPWILTTFEDIHGCTTGSQLQQKEIVVSTKDDFYFPFANVLKNYEEKNLKQVGFSLYQLYDSSFISNFNDFVTIDQESKYLILSKHLKPGKYSLLLPYNSDQMLVQVLVSEWQNNSIMQHTVAKDIEYNINQNEMVKLSNSNNMPLQIKNVNVNQNQTRDLDILTIEITANNNSLKQTRAHIFFSHFVNRQSWQNDDSYFPVIHHSPRVELKTQQRQNDWLEDRSINDEYRYVLERLKVVNNKQESMGNGLKKPSLLVKPQFSQDTMVNEENLDQGSEWESLNLTPGDSDNFVMFAWNSFGHSSVNFVTAGPVFQDWKDSYVTSEHFLDFVKNTSTILYNLAPKNGKISVNLSQMYVLYKRKSVFFLYFRM